MSDFNFVVNSLWPDIVEKFELQLPMVFSAGKGHFSFRFTSVICTYLCMVCEF